MRIEAYLPAVAPILRAQAAQAAPHEACGVLTRARSIIEIPNRATNPSEAFDLGPLCDIESRTGELIAIWHTHPEDQPPSVEDVKQCRATFLPWIIAGPVRVWVIYPEPQPYQGREFAYGIEDCWCTVSDWHAQEAGIFLPWFERPADGWWKTAGPSPYIENARRFGFVAAPLCEWGLENLRVGDVILMQVAARRTNHAAVYVGGGSILHHLYGELSRPETFDSRYQQMTTYVARHETLNRPC